MFLKMHFSASWVAFFATTAPTPSTCALVCPCSPLLMVPTAIRPDFVTNAEIYENALESCGLYGAQFDNGRENGEGICESLTVISPCSQHLYAIVQGCHISPIDTLKILANEVQRQPILTTGRFLGRILRLFTTITSNFQFPLSAETVFRGRWNVHADFLDT